MVEYFLKFVEAKTKTISVISFLVGLLFYIYYLMPEYGIDIINILIFFIAMLSVDMFTTAVNHISAYYHEEKKTVYDQDLLEDMKVKQFNMKTNYTIVIILVIIFIVLGIFLVYRSNIGVLLLGMFSVFIGAIYSLGKKPISYTPFGEIFAGGVEGVILPVIIIFTQFNHLPFELNPLLVIVFMPLAFMIGSILFANNLCDLEIDVYNGRYTLAYYTKKKFGLKLLYLSNLGALGCVTLASVLEFIPLNFNILYLLLIPLSKNVLKFGEKFSKEESFSLILKNFIIFSLGYIIIFILNILI